MEYDLFVEKKLPKNLDEKTLYEYIKKFKKGDSSYRDIIINSNIRLVIRIVNKKYLKTPYEMKDLVSIGILGLIKAVDTFDIDKSIKFSSYASKCIENEILMTLRKCKKENKNISIETETATFQDGDTALLIDYIKDDTDIEEDYIHEEEKIIIKNLVEKLEDKDKEIIKLYFGFYGKTYKQREIGQMIGVHPANISRKIIKILIKLKKQMEDEKIMSRKIKSIYEYFNTYTREEIDQMIKTLTEEERKLLYLRYGSDLDNPKASEKFDKEYSNKFYGNLLPKMNRRLKNIKENTKITEKIEMPKEITNVKIEEVSKESIIEENKQIVLSNTINKEDYIKMLEFIKTPLFNQILNTLPIKEATIISLTLGNINNKYFTSESIANFLEIDESEVIEINKNILLLYKSYLNEYIDNTIKIMIKRN